MGLHLKSAELEELQRKEIEKELRLSKDIVGRISQGKKEPVARYLYPKIPWKKGEMRGLISFTLMPSPWIAIPFYEKPIIMLGKWGEKTLKNIFGLTSDEILELWKKGRLYPISAVLFTRFSGKKYEHMHQLIEKGMPISRSSALHNVIYGRNSFNKFKQEARGLSIFSEWGSFYAALCEVGLRERLLRGHELALSLEKRGADISVLKDLWLGDLVLLCVDQPLHGSPTIANDVVLRGAFTLLGTPRVPAESFAHEVAGELLDLVGLSGPADPNEVNVDMIIEAQNHAKDLRNSYGEFSKRVDELQVKEAIEQADAVQIAADEFRKSVPFLDKAAWVAHQGVSISAAALSVPALTALGMPWLAPVAAGSGYGAIQDAARRRWLDGPLARLLSKIKLGPFAYTHTWKTLRSVKRTK